MQVSTIEDNDDSSEVKVVKAVKIDDSVETTESKALIADDSEV